MTPYAFYFDSSACSGCKACQAACKDKHHLPVGLLWRRVYEVTSGGWLRSGQAWTSDVFAFNLSISCNHCAQPICVEVCPAQAIRRHADGIVLIDQTKCVGCQYCSWACPYDAPQYDRAHGYMTKCNFCADNLAAALPPACVTACPLRVLDFGEVHALAAEHGSLSGARPLPDESLTQPALIVKPHQAAHRESVLGNAEEVRAPYTSERSLVAFTILAQMAVGAVWFFSLLQAFNPTTLGVITIIMLLGMLASFLHLGSPLKAWRALSGWRSSWLSREVWCAVLLAASLVGLTITGGAGAWLVGVIGFALMISMAQVYRLRTVLGWNQWTVTASFFTTTLLLGALLCGALGGGRAWLAVLTIGLLGAQQTIGWRWSQAGRWRHLIPVLRVLAIGALVIDLLASLWIAWLVAFVLVLSSEVLARALFYEIRKPRSVWRFAAHPSPSLADH